MNHHLENADVIRVRKSSLARWAYLAGLVGILALALWAIHAAASEPVYAPVAKVDPRKASLPTPAPIASATQAGPARQSPSEGIEGQIRAIAADEGYQAPSFLVRLARCESGLDPAAKSKTSSARGLFQIIGKVSDQCAYSVDCSTRWTIQQLTHGHASWWACTEIIST